MMVNYILLCNIAKLTLKYEYIIKYLMLKYLIDRPKMPSVRKK